GESASGSEGDVGAELAAVGVAAHDDLQVAFLLEELLEAVAENLGLPLPPVVAVFLEGLGDFLGQLEGMGDEALRLELLFPSAPGHGGPLSRQPRGRQS